MRIFYRMKLKCLVCGFIYNSAIIYGSIQYRLMSSYVPDIVLDTDDVVVSQQVTRRQKERKLRCKRHLR